MHFELKHGFIITKYYKMDSLHHSVHVSVKVHIKTLWSAPA